ncbi:MAG: hypothetical protein H8D45_27265 [Bacteroidetes bacterium]|nr:hypothetical protein [Bacteroidota bacterium]
MNIQILGPRVLIKRFSKEEELYEKAQEAGLIIEKKDGDRQVVEKGEIVKVGQELDSWADMKNQKVIFNSWAGDEVEYNGQKYLVVHKDDILAVYK